MPLKNPPQTRNSAPGDVKKPDTRVGGLGHAKLAFCTTTTALKHGIEQNFLELGRRLEAIRREDMWKGRWEDFEDYLENDLKISKGTASKLIAIYQTFVEKYKFPRETLAPASWSNLYTVIPLIESKEDAEEWVERAATLTRTDLLRSIEERKTGRSMVDCDHEFEPINMVKCRKCHVKHLKYEDNETQS